MHTNTVLAGAAALVFLFLAAACSTTQSPQTQLDDTAITANIKSKLAAERVQTLTNVEVNTTNGVVTLAGQVENEDIRRKAEQIARQSEGVREVRNNLQIAAGAAPASKP